MSIQEKELKCYLYTRVAAQAQADSYALDAQREQLRREAERRGMTVAAEFSDVGDSVTGRPQFAEMLNRI